MVQSTTPTTSPALPLRRGVILPGTVTRVPVGRARSRALADKLEPGDRFVLPIQFDAGVDEPAIADIHPIGVLVELKDKRPARQGGHMVLLVHSLERVRIHALNTRGDNGNWEASWEPVEETETHTEEAELLASSLRALLSELADHSSVKDMLAQSTDPGLLADRVAGFLDLPASEKVGVLRELSVEERLRLVADLFKKARERAKLREKIDSEVRQNLSKGQRDVLLRQQLQAIRKELGEGDDGDDELTRLRKAIDEADLPEEVRTAADRELRRLARMQGPQPEGHVIRNYLEWIAELPWNTRADTSEDIDAIADALDADHHGLEEPKRRILEHMAVMKLASNPRGTILALVGPPGVGKTSLAQSVADATGRPLARVSLGGVRDESEIRGHRRTYVGALPGRILTALKKVGAKNPVMVLDEIDKLGRGWAGDPEAALLEVLDPEQNNTFTDHYMDLPFDLSEVLFIATANDISALSPPLRDRLEVIDVHGYTVDEKIVIARNHLWPKQLREHGLSDDDVVIAAPELELVINEYTREGGVRQLGRTLAKLCRSLALRIARDESERGHQHPIEETDVRKILGRPKFLKESAEQVRPPGVAAGLAWTPVGGDVLYVETTQMPGKGKLEITGQLGDVMNESARAALAYLRSHADELDVDPTFLERSDLHIHVPAGGIPKDGPSAGVTMFTALASLLTGRRVRPDTAMTGEASLRGRVLPVGGIKSKLLAAHRAGFTRVILPKRNEHDLDEIPDTVLAELDIVLADNMHQVFKAALVEEGQLLTPDETAPVTTSPVVAA